ncbi:glycoprotein hormone beta-5 isoform X2 [Takifugu flavidus]|uniref:glycoprotein hormone beta-5 isoform X2 n=1 Tax=Takifugu flavidus TaxID=433684 RepID=UPI0025440C3C|nr:glycoprotein hormone beta-5 isoform X2 [Takifugu flavidus]
MDWERAGGGAEGPPGRIRQAGRTAIKGLFHASEGELSGQVGVRRSDLLLPLLLLLWFSSPTLSARQTPAVNLHRFVGCAVREFTFLARKPGCGALHITTDACWGRCETWEKPVLDPPFVDTYQRVCTYNRSRVVTVSLPGCLPDVDPAYSYPVALRCDCSVCVTSTTECITSV